MLGKTNVKVKPNKKKPLIDYVEYIESTGTQYIDTGYYPSSNSRVEFGFMPTATTLTATNTKILQASSGASTPSFGACFAGGGGTAGNARFTFGSTYSYYVDITGLNNNNRKDMIMDCMASTVTANGEQTYNVTKTSFECTETLKVFERGGGCVGRLYYLRIYENNTLVHDFKPCKDGAGVYCLYDEVEQRYYYNQGTGNFIGEGANYFTSSIAPLGWTEVVEGLEYTATNDYGTWRIWADNCSSTLSPVKYAFDTSTGTNLYYQNKGDSNIGIDLPEGLLICPFTIQVVCTYMGANSYIQGLNEEGEWETLTEIAKSNSKVTQTLNISTSKFYSKFRCYLKQYSTNYTFTRVMDFKITNGLIKAGGDV